MTQDLWRVPAHLPYLQPALTQEAVAQVEEHFGVRLPSAYLTILRQQNGGYVRRQLRDPQIPHSMIWGIGPHFPNIAGYCEPLDPETAELDDVWVPADSSRLVPFDGDGHWYLCLDYRGGASEPGVSFIDIESQDDRLVADSFEAFLGLLKTDYSGINLGITNVTSVEEAIARLEPVVPCRFERPTSDGTGYPVHRCCLAHVSKSTWLWLSPNSVPRGNVAPHDKRYAELKDLLPGQSLRWSEAPQVVVTAGCTSDALALLAESCEKAGLVTIVPSALS